MDSTYWNDIYKKKSEREVSWFQEVPAKSLELIEEFHLQPDDPIIDIGAGDSHLVDALLDRGFTDVTVLDISPVSLDKAKARLGNRATTVNFIASDVTQFSPTRAYRLWHDRAAFHFLTTEEEVEAYLHVASAALVRDGLLIVSTFSKSGPEKCSGLTVARYSDNDLKSLFGRYFSNVRCIDNTHVTPWGAEQNFVYCGFKKKAKSYTLIYFRDCPNVPIAIELLKNVGIEFVHVVQDDLPEEHELREFSSPTLLEDAEIVFGSKAGSHQACSLKLPTERQLLETLYGPDRQHKSELFDSPGNDST